MPFLTATGDVASVLLAGGLGYAESLIGLGLGFERIVELLRERYTPIGGLPYSYQVYQAVVNRARAALLSGRQLDSQPGNQPLPRNFHVGLPGLQSEYQYGVVGTFVDPDTGREFTRQFFVTSNTALGSVDVLAQATAEAFDWAAGGPTLPAIAGHDAPIPTNFTIVDALVRI